MPAATVRLAQSNPQRIAVPVSRGSGMVDSAFDVEAGLRVCLATRRERGGGCRRPPADPAPPSCEPSSTTLAYSPQRRRATRRAEQTEVMALTSHVTAGNKALAGESFESLSGICTGALRPLALQRSPTSSRAPNRDRSPRSRERNSRRTCMRLASSRCPSPSTRVCSPPSARPNRCRLRRRTSGRRWIRRHTDSSQCSSPDRSSPPSCTSRRGSTR